MSPLISINPAELQRIKQVQLGSTRAVRFASRYTATGAMGSSAAFIIMAAFGNNCPVLQNPEDHPTFVKGALRQSLKGNKVGSHIEFRCLYYGIILSEGNRAYEVHPKEIGPGKTVRVTRAMNLRTPRGKIINKTISYNLVTRRTLTIMYDGYKTHPTWVPHPASDGSKWIPVSIAEASLVLVDLQQLFGKKVIEIVSAPAGYEVDEGWIRRTGDMLAAELEKNGWVPKDI